MKDAFTQDEIALLRLTVRGYLPPQATEKIKREIHNRREQFAAGPATPKKKKARK